MVPQDLDLLELTFGIGLDEPIFSLEYVYVVLGARGYEPTQVKWSEHKNDIFYGLIERGTVFEYALVHDVQKLK